MPSPDFNRTKTLLVLAAVFLAAGLLFGPRFTAPLLATRLSADGTLEEGTLVFLKEFQVGLLSIACVLALLGAANAFTRTSRPHPAARFIALGAILVMAAYLVFLPPYYAAKLLAADPAVYAVSAHNMFRGEGYVLTLDHQQIPPLFLIGYPLSILPFYLLFGPFLGNAIYATFCAALLAAAATYAFARRLFGTKAALLTVLLLCSNWLFIEMSCEVRSDILATFLMALALLLFIMVITDERRFYLHSFLLGLVLGFSFTVRPPNLVILAVLPFVLLPRKGAGLTAQGLLALIMGMAFVVVPYMVFCNAAYGAPLRTGYHAWLPWRFEGTPFLTPRNIALNRAYQWMYPDDPNLIQRLQMYLQTTNGAFYSSGLLGLNKVYSPAVLVFIIAGVAGALRRRGDRRTLTLCILSVIGLSLLFYVMVLVNSYRYFLPFLPPLLALAGYGMARKVPFSRRERIGAAGIAYALLFAIAVAPAGLALYRRAVTPPPPPLQYEVCAAYRELAPPDGCVISGIDPVLVEHFVLRGSVRSFFALSERSLYVDQRFRLKPEDPVTTLPVIPASRRLDEIRAMIDGGTVVLMDNWESPFQKGRYREDLEMMKANFGAKEVARRGPCRVYRLTNLPENRTVPDE